MTRIIKRYQNRKLYDTKSSSYVTLTELADVIKAGESIKVIDNKTKADVTYRTQLNILIENEKRSGQAEGADLLNNIIRSEKDTFTGFIQKLQQSH